MTAFTSVMTVRMTTAFFMELLVSSPSLPWNWSSSGFLTFFLFVTELFCDHGLIERMPQRWTITEAPLEFYIEDGGEHIIFQAPTAGKSPQKNICFFFITYVRVVISLTSVPLF